MRGILPALLFTAAASLTPSLAAQTAPPSPAEEQWNDFISWNPGERRIPEDEHIGLLADRRHPDSSWVGALAVCDALFDALAEGRVPEELFLDDLRVPLTRDFQSLLEGGALEVAPRYGRPVREGARLHLAARAFAGTAESRGWIYLVRSDGRWLIEQWALDLSGLPRLADE